MRIRDFDWDSKNIEHISEHGVQDYEVEEVILFDKAIILKGREKRYVAYGVTESGRYLFVAFAIKGKGLIRVITARDMVGKEKRYYKKRK